MRILLGILLLSLVWLSGNAQTLDSCVAFTPRHVVVIGSSTAAGTGASVPDSAWVNRYRSYLTNLHPEYEVSNLAKGGYQTYHLMPTGFVPPPGRNQPDTLRNITRALSLDPDAIIVNLPSNDAAVGISAAEQMQNFRAMQALALAQDVSFWICTPQPRIFDSTKVAIQWALLDSIEAYFAPKVLDFWDQIAEPSGLPSGIYDAGDGVHLNDLGHRILAERVEEAQIPHRLIQEATEADFRLIAWKTSAACTSGQPGFEVELANFGLADTAKLVWRWASNGISITDSSLQWINPCEKHAILMEEVLPQPGLWDLKLWIYGNNGTELHDSAATAVSVYEVPPPYALGDSVCWGEPVALRAQSSLSQGSNYWFVGQSLDSILWKGDSLILDSLTNSPNLAARTLLEPLKQPHTLASAQQYDRTWNGIMFDLTAQDSLVLDSLQLNFAYTGSQTLMIWRKSDSHLGFEQIPQAWQRWDSVDITVGPGAWTWVDMDSIVLAAGETLGLYLHLQDPSNRLRYDGVNSLQVFRDPYLELTSGTGITHTFGQTYFPRAVNARVAYHRFSGSCWSEATVVPLAVGPAPDMEIDTLAVYGDTLDLQAPDGHNFQWSNGGTTQVLSLPTDGIEDTLMLWVDYLDAFECQRRKDFVLIPVANTGFLHGLNPELPSIHLRGQVFTVEGIRDQIDGLELADLQGRNVYQWAEHNQAEYYLPEGLGAGIYYLRVLTERGRWTLRLPIW